MSLVTDLAGVANRLIGPQGLAGFAVTFSRTVAQPYDPITNTEAPAVITTWGGRAIWTKNGSQGADATVRTDATGRLVVARTLLVAGSSVSIVPQPGDGVVGGGVVGVCGDVDKIGDADGATVPLYRVKVAA